MMRPVCQLFGRKLFFMFQYTLTSRYAMNKGILKPFNSLCHKNPKSLRVQLAVWRWRFKAPSHIRLQSLIFRRSLGLTSFSLSGHVSEYVALNYFLYCSFIGLYEKTNQQVVLYWCSWYLSSSFQKIHEPTCHSKSGPGWTWIKGWNKSICLSQ